MLAWIAPLTLRIPRGLYYTSPVPAAPCPILGHSSSLAVRALATILAFPPSYRHRNDRQPQQQQQQQQQQKHAWRCTIPCERSISSERLVVLGHNLLVRVQPGVGPVNATGDGLASAAPADAAPPSSASPAWASLRCSLLLGLLLLEID